ncbi:MAG TPA: hypothetical protein VE776_10225 [Actinomycetota bacterium]|jgi:hypothetical protein|nr:hypothetical protein [Actinomycetota bacterium]
MRPATVQLIDLGLEWSFDHSMAFAASTKDLDTVAAALAADSEITSEEIWKTRLTG